MTDLPTDLTPLVVHSDVLAGLASLPRGSVHTAVFSPPFWGLRRYDVCVCSLTRHASEEFRAWGGVGPRGESTGQISADDRRNRKEPDPDCQWCHGTGTIPGMETLWGADPSCDHKWEETPPRRARRAADEGNLPSNGNYDAKGGEFCVSCHGWYGSLGLEPTPGLYVAHMVLVFRALRPAMRDDGIIWAEIGDTYITHPAGFTGRKRWAASTLSRGDHMGAEQAGSFDKRFGTIFRGRDMSGHIGSGGMEKVVPGGLAEGNIAFIPHRTAIALQDDGWVIRQDNVGVWDRPNPMPESVRNRSSRSHSYIFQITKGMDYYWDPENARQAQTGNAHRRDGPVRKLAAAGSGIESNTSWNDATNQLLPHETGRNIVSVWRFPTQSFHGKHYATYPLELPRRCVSIATSDRGCCPQCGAPFERVTTLGVPDREWQRASGGDVRGEYGGVSKGGYIDTGAEDPSDVKRRILAGMYPKVTVGWKPRCSCFPDPCDRCGVPWEHRTALRKVSAMNIHVRDGKKGILGQKSGLGGDAADVTDDEIEEYDEDEGIKIREVDVSWPGCGCRALVPAVVLDPFSGSGTSLVVARRLYRRSIGIELSPFYVDMCRRRLTEETAALSPRAGSQSRLTEFAEAV